MIHNPSPALVADRETIFHDEWANSTTTEDVLVYESFKSPLALENRFALNLMGDIRDKKIADVGSGLGEAAVYFALQGAEVIATDISPGMVEQAKLLARHHGVEIQGVVSSAERLDIADNSVDICYSANLLHHVTDRSQTLAEMHRIIKPGGLIVTWDPLIYNPIINIYRRMATEVRTEDEEPLRFAILQDYSRYFEQVRHREFWLTSLLIFIKYYLLDRVHPNQDRYWKRILKETPSTVGWLKPLLKFDQLLLRLPLVNHLAWTTLIYARKAKI